MRVKKAAGFPIFYRTPPALVWQGFQPLNSAIYRTEHMARTVENPKNRRGFPFYSSGASNPKGSGAQYCSPPDTVIGIETLRRLHRRLGRFLIVALQIPSSVLKRLREHAEFQSHVIVALQIPSSVLKRSRSQTHDPLLCQIVALQIPSSVLKRRCACEE